MRSARIARSSRPRGPEPRGRSPPEAAPAVAARVEATEDDPEMAELEDALAELKARERG